MPTNPCVRWVHGMAHQDLIPSRKGLRIGVVPPQGEKFPTESLVKAFANITASRVKVPPKPFHDDKVYLEGKKRSQRNIKIRWRGGRCRCTDTRIQRYGGYWRPAPRGEGPQMGLEIVSSMRQIFGALIGCCSNCPLTFYPKRPRHLRQREISYQVLVGPKDSPGLIYAAGSIRSPSGGKILSWPLTYWDFHGIFAVIFIVLFPFISAASTELLAG